MKIYTFGYRTFLQIIITCKNHFLVSLSGYTLEDLHLFSFTKAGTSVPDEPCETPTPEGRAVMSGEGVAYCASPRRERNGVKRHVLILHRYKLTSNYSFIKIVYC